MQNKPAKQKEYDNTGPKDPFILLSPPLHLSNRIATDAQRIGNVVHAPLRALEHFPLLAQIRQDGPSAVEKLVDLRIRVGKEGLLAQRVFLSTKLFSGGAETQTAAGRGRCAGKWTCI